MKNFKPSALITVLLIFSLSLYASKDKSEKSKLLKGGDSAQKISVDLTGFNELYLIVSVGGDNFHNDQSIWANPILIDKDGKKVDLTTIKPSNMKVGWGKLHLNKDHKNNPLNIGGDPFEKGFWAHAPSVLSFKLKGRYKKFEAMVGIGSAAGKNGSVIFEVSNKGPITKKNVPKELVENQDSPFDPTAMIRVIKDMSRTWPDRFKDAETLITEVRKYEDQLKNADEAKIKEMHSFRKKVMLRNPLLDFDKLLLIRRKGNLGLPTNWTSNSSIPKNSYDNELGLLSIKDKNGKLSSIYRPPEKGFIGDLDLHFNAGKVLFSSIGKNKAWQVFEMGVDGKQLREVTKTKDPTINNYDPCYLPDGRILFSSTAPKVAVPCVNGKAPVANIFRINADGTGMDQLCYDQEHGWHPQVMSDGKIMYSRWEYADLPHSNSRILMTMNPDGTNQRSIYGSNSYWPNSLFYARQVPGSPSKFVGIVSGHHGVRRMGELILFDSNKGTEEADGVVQRIPGFGKKVEPVVADRLVNRSWPRFLHPYPLSDKYFLVSGQLSPKHSWNLYLVDVFDNITLLKHDSGTALFEPVPLQKTPVPPIIPDRIRPGNKEGTVFISDIYEGPGLKDIPKGEVKKLRLFTYTYGYNNLGGLYGSIGIDGPWDMRRIIGTVPVQKDGSAVFNIPANTPISIQPLDEDGKALQLMRSWFIARPGEMLSCVGCHEPPNAAPSVKPSIAMRKAPDQITNWYGPVRNYEFEREVQPVLDKHCVSCHNGSERDDGQTLPDFAGGKMITDWKRKHAGSISPKQGGGKFSKSYFNLFRYGRTPGIESQMHLLNPMEFHADATELMMKLQKGHHGVKLDDEAKSRLVTWIDLNAPYHGRWSTIAGTKAVQKEDERAVMRKLYANVEENHEYLEDTPLEIKQVKPKPLLPIKKGDTNCENWPFDKTKALQLQNKKEGTMSLGNGVTMRLVYIPAGEFIMGSPEGHRDETPMTRTRINKGFWMGKFEVTNKQMKAVMPGHSSKTEDRHGYQFGITGYDVDLPDMPAVRVNWKQTQEFCRQLAEKTGMKIQLPTEAQWEWACRAGTDTPMNYGKLKDDFAKFANLADITLADFNGNPYAQDRIKARYKNAENIYDNWIPQISNVNDGGFISEPVGKYNSNAWGLHDMHGNAAEWTRSLYKPYPYSDGDGRNDIKAEGKRVVRGGSWRDRPKLSTSSFRRMYKDFHKVYNVGFRVVVEDDGQKLTAPSQSVKHRILLGSYGANDLMILGPDNKVEWSMPGLTKVTDVQYMENGNIIYSHTNGITEIKPDYKKGEGAETVFSWNVPKQSELSGKEVNPNQEKGETHSCQIMEDGKILTGVSYDKTSYILEIDKKGEIYKKIALADYGTTHGSFRNIRKTSKGTYLVTRVGKPFSGLEVDVEGKTLREIKDGRYVMVSLPNSNILVAGADAHKVYELDPDGKTVWEVAEKDIDGISLAAVCGVQRLPNGNTVISLWGGHGNLPGPAAIEVTRDKKLVWQTPDSVKNRVITLQVLDEQVLSQKRNLR